MPETNQIIKANPRPQFPVSQNGGGITFKQIKDYLHPASFQKMEFDQSIALILKELIETCELYSIAMPESPRAKGMLAKMVVNEYPIGVGEIEKAFDYARKANFSFDMYGKEMNLDLLGRLIQTYCLARRKEFKEEKKRRAKEIEANRVFVPAPRYSMDEGIDKARSS